MLTHLKTGSVFNKYTRRDLSVEFIQTVCLIESKQTCLYGYTIEPSVLVLCMCVSWILVIFFYLKERRLFCIFNEKIK